MNQQKELNLGQSVYELCRAHPELKEILLELGFTDILYPGILQTAGRFMTLPKGARMKGIDLASILKKLRVWGFDPMGGEHTEQGNQQSGISVNCPPRAAP